MSTIIIDVSSNNAEPNWRKAKAEGVRGVFVKATEGKTFTNPRLVNDWRNADNAGLIVGSYHFARQDVNSSIADARLEAKHYVAAMRKLPGHSKDAWLSGNLVPVLDFEVGTSDKKYSPWRDAFFDTVSVLTGHDCMLYTFAPFNDWAPPQEQSQSRLWIASFGSSFKVPGGYKDADLWQYTDRATFGGVQVDASKLPEGHSLKNIRCQVDG